jgi:hypothetical protein
MSSVHAPRVTHGEGGIDQLGAVNPPPAPAGDGKSRYLGGWDMHLAFAIFSHDHIIRAGQERQKATVL